LESTLRWNLRIALLGLTHPASLAAIGLLLLNDHVLKRAYPSALTGKLSDFAGLFFFPYLIVAVLSMAGMALRPLSTGRSRTAGLIQPALSSLGAVAIAGSALTFSLIKLYPGIGGWVSNLGRNVLGLPIQIVSDPTDLLALIVLWPCRRLWLSLGCSRRRPLRRRSIAALGLASLAALATSLPPQPVVLTHLVSAGSDVYALANDEGQVFDAFVSTDQGENWEGSDPPAPVVKAGERPVRYPKIACVPDLEQTCYRVAGESKLEASVDGGNSWRTVWSIPASRQSFMRRVVGGSRIFLFVFGSTKEPDARAYDLVIVGAGEEHYALAVTGNEGVLRGKVGEGDWSRIPVLQNYPTPTRVEAKELLASTWIIGSELFLALIAATLSYYILSARSWTALEREAPKHKAKLLDWWPWLLGSALLLILLVVWSRSSQADGTVGPRGMAQVLILTLATVSYRRWARAAGYARNRAIAWRLFGITALGSLLVFISGALPFVLWAMGCIPWHTAALLLVVAAIWFVFRSARRQLQMRTST